MLVVIGTALLLVVLCFVTCIDISIELRCPDYEGFCKSKLLLLLLLLSSFLSSLSLFSSVELMVQITADLGNYDFCLHAYVIMHVYVV